MHVKLTSQKVQPLYIPVCLKRGFQTFAYMQRGLASRGGVAKRLAGLGGVGVVVRVCRARCVRVAIGVVCIL